MQLPWLADPEKTKKAEENKVKDHEKMQKSTQLSCLLLRIGRLLKTFQNALQILTNASLPFALSNIINIIIN